MAYYVTPPFEGRQDGNRVIWESSGEVAWLEPYGPDSIRFRSSRSLRIDDTLDWTLLPPEKAEDVEITITEAGATLRNGKITATVTGDGTVSYFRSSTGELLLEEDWIDGRVHTAPLRRAREFRVRAGDYFAIDLFFRPQKDEHFYGMGQDANDCFDLKGSEVELFQKNGKCTIPYVYSSRGYGFLWNNPAVGRTEFAANYTRWHANTAKQIDYLVLAGDTPAEINSRFVAMTGKAPMLPEWACGLWQSKLRYETQEELLEVAREYKRRGLPLSVIVIDYFHWTMQGEWKFDPACWPDPEGMVRELEEMGVKLMVSIWPTVDTRSENYAEMQRKNYVIHTEKGVDSVFLFFGIQTYYDATHPGAREFVWSRAKEHYYDKGVKLFWLDEAEPEMRPYDFDNVRMYAGNADAVGNLYCDGYAQTFYEGMKQEGETEICNLIRCAWLGTQRYGIILWSGDIASTFDSLRKQMKAGLHVSLCGIPWWTTDIGGFINGDPALPSFRELIVRWFQYGVFCPILRTHGFRLPYPERRVLDPEGECRSGGPNEAWSYGEEAYAIIVKFLRLRERMKPYILEQMRRATEDGTPVMRPLFYDFPGEEALYAIGDQYLFGPSIMVAPIVEEGCTARSVYLPKGAIWTEVSTGKSYPGGTSLTVDAPLDSIPLFVRGEEIPLFLQELMPG